MAVTTAKTEAIVRPIGRVGKLPTQQLKTGTYPQDHCAILHRPRQRAVGDQGGRRPHLRAIFPTADAVDVAAGYRSVGWRLNEAHIQAPPLGPAAGTPR